MGGQALRVDDLEVASWSRFLGNSVRLENGISARSVCQDQPAQYLRSNRSDTRHLPKSLQQSSPFSPNKLKGEDMGDTSDIVTKNPGTSGVPREQTRTQLHRSLTLHVTEPAKVVARKVAASPDTVESHRQQIPQSWANLIAYCRAYPAFALDVVEAMGLDLDRDRDAYATFLQLQRQVRGE